MSAQASGCSRLRLLLAIESRRGALYLGHPRATRAGPCRDRSGSSGRSPCLRHDCDGDDQGGNGQPCPSIVARPRHSGSEDPAVGCPDESACPARMHSSGDPRSSDTGIPSGGHGKVGGQSGRDQPRARAQHKRIAEEWTLIMPSDPASWARPDHRRLLAIETLAVTRLDGASLIAGP